MDNEVSKEEKLREQARNRYWKNPEHYRLKSLKNYHNRNEQTREHERKRHHKWVLANRDINYKNLEEMFGSTCIMCGGNFGMHVFDYHHPNPKIKNGKLYIYGWKWAKVFKYVKNTVQVCANCHRDIHDKIKRGADPLTAHILIEEEA